MFTEFRIQPPLILSGDFSGEEGSRTGEGNPDERRCQVQAEAGEHADRPQVESVNRASSKEVRLGSGCDTTSQLIFGGVYVFVAAGFMSLRSS